MSLYERLCGRDDNGFADENLRKIAINQFAAMLQENTYGDFARADIITELNLDAPETVDLDIILAKGANPAARRELNARLLNILYLAEINTAGYGLPSQLRGMIEAL